MGRLKQAGMEWTKSVFCAAEAKIADKNIDQLASVFCLLSTFKKCSPSFKYARQTVF